MLTWHASVMDMLRHYAETHGLLTRVVASVTEPTDLFALPDTPQAAAVPVNPFVRPTVGH
jgi:hypothetical protein